MQVQDQTAQPPPGPAIPMPAAADLQDHLLVAGHDLDRLQGLLAHASESLLEHFHGANDELQSLLGTTSGPDGDDQAGLLRLRAHLAAAITAMQFQDMASQLVQHTGRRLRNCADRLAIEAFADDDEDGEPVYESAPLRPNPVTQDEMDAGSVELF